MGESTTVRVHNDTKQQLDSFIKLKTDTHDSVISKLIYFYKTNGGGKGVAGVKD